MKTISNLYRIWTIFECCGCPFFTEDRSRIDEHLKRVLETGKHQDGGQWKIQEFPEDHGERPIGSCPISQMPKKNTKTFLDKYPEFKGSVQIVEEGYMDYGDSGDMVSIYALEEILDKHFIKKEEIKEAINNVFNQCVVANDIGPLDFDLADVERAFKWLEEELRLNDGLNGGQ